MKNLFLGIVIGVPLGILLWVLIKPLAILLLFGLAIVGAYTLYNAGRNGDPSSDSNES